MANVFRSAVSLDVQMEAEHGEFQNKGTVVAPLLFQKWDSIVLFTFLCCEIIIFRFYLRRMIWSCTTCNNQEKNKHSLHPWWCSQLILSSNMASHKKRLKDIFHPTYHRFQLYTPTKTSKHSLIQKMGWRRQGFPFCLKGCAVSSIFWINVHTYKHTP